MTSETLPVASRECLVANISQWYWDAARDGKPHFRAGAKVFVVGQFMGFDGESVYVLGRHIKSHRWIELLMRTHFLENVRVSQEYSPAIIARLETCDYFSHLYDLDNIRDRINDHAGAWQERKIETFESAVESEPGTGRLLSRVFSFGGKRFVKDPPETVKRELLARHTVAEMQAIFDRIESVNSWEELLVDAAKE